MQSVGGGGQRSTCTVYPKLHALLPLSVPIKLRKHCMFPLKPVILCVRILIQYTVKKFSH